MASLWRTEVGQKTSSNYNRFILKGFFSASICFVAMLAVISPQASAANTEITANVQEVLSLSATKNSIDFNLMPTESGTSSFDSVTLNVVTNSPNGYQLTMSSANTAMVSATGGSGQIASVTNGTATSPQPLSVNTWGWYADSFGSFSQQYVSLPESGMEQLIRNTDTFSNSSSTTVTFGVNVGMSLPADTYTDTVIFSAVSNYVPPVQASPSFINATESNANDVYPTTGWAGDTITITSNGQFQNVSSVTIGGTACTDFVVDSANLIRCVLPDLSVNYNGYAIAVTANDTPIDLSGLTVRYINPSRDSIIGQSTTSNNTMQSFTTENCSAMSTNQIVTLTDSRNKQSYRIKKMADGKCWMIDNLKYAGEANTDLANIDGTYGIIFNNSSSTYNTQNGQVSPYSSNNFDKAFYNNPASQSYCHDSGIANSYTGCGFFYNWYAATAGTGIYETPEPNVNVTGSICPSGWSLPSGTSDGTTPTSTGSSYAAADFPVLNASMLAGYPTTGTYISEGYYQNWQYNSPWEGIFTGQRRNSFIDAGATQIYWTSTAYQSNDGTKSNARTLVVTNNLVAPGADFATKFTGAAVRCVMRTSN